MSEYYETVAETIRDVLKDNWALEDKLAVTRVIFEYAWYNPEYAQKPQVTVSPLYRPDHSMFGPAPGSSSLSLMSWEQYVANLWWEVPYGDPGKEDFKLIEQMRLEVIRILNETRNSYTLPISMVYPRDQGRPLHELDRTPRVLRIEIMVQVDIAT